MENNLDGAIPGKCEMVFPGKARSGFAGSWVKRKVGAVLRFYQKLNRAGDPTFRR
jgi:hypothetical protein